MARKMSILESWVTFDQGDFDQRICTSFCIPALDNLWTRFRVYGLMDNPKIRCLVGEINDLNELTQV